MAKPTKEETAARVAKMLATRKRNAAAKKKSGAGISIPLSAVPPQLPKAPAAYQKKPTTGDAGVALARELVALINRIIK